MMDDLKLKCNGCGEPVTRWPRRLLHARADVWPVLCPRCSFFRKAPSAAACTRLDPSPSYQEIIWRPVAWRPRTNPLDSRPGYRATLERRIIVYGKPLEARTDPRETFESLKVTGRMKVWQPASTIEAESSPTAQVAAPDPYYGVHFAAVAATLEEIERTRGPRPGEVYSARVDASLSQIKVASLPSTHTGRHKKECLTKRVPEDREPAVEYSGEEPDRRPMRKYGKPYPGKRYLAASDYRRAVARRTWLHGGIEDGGVDPVTKHWVSWTTGGIPVSTYGCERGYVYGQLAPYGVRVAESRQCEGGPPLPAMPAPEPYGEQAGPENILAPIRPPDLPRPVYVLELGREDVGTVVDLANDLRRDNAPWSFHSYWADRSWATIPRHREDERDLEDHGWARKSAQRLAVTDKAAFAAMLAHTGLANPRADTAEHCARYAERRFRAMPAPAIPILPASVPGKAYIRQVEREFRAMRRAGKRVEVSELGRAMWAGLFLGSTGGELVPGTKGVYKVSSDGGPARTHEVQRFLDRELLARLAERLRRRARQLRAV